MKKIIDDYSPILENVPFEEIKEQVKEKEKKKESEEDSLHLDDTPLGEDIPVGE
jgi:hypothetical protein